MDERQGCTDICGTVWVRYIFQHSDTYFSTVHQTGFIVLGLFDGEQGGKLVDPFYVLLLYFVLDYVYTVCMNCLHQDTTNTYLFAG